MYVKNFNYLQDYLETNKNKQKNIGKSNKGKLGIKMLDVSKLGWTGKEAETAESKENPIEEIKKKKVELRLAPFVRIIGEAIKEIEKELKEPRCYSSSEEYKNILGIKY